MNEIGYEDADILVEEDGTEYTIEDENGEDMMTVNISIDFCFEGGK